MTAMTRTVLDMEIEGVRPRGRPSEIGQDQGRNDNEMSIKPKPIPAIVYGSECWEVITKNVRTVKKITHSSLYSRLRQHLSDVPAMLGPITAREK